MRQHHAHGRRSGRPGGWQQANQPDAGDAAEWFAGRLPDWFDGDPTVVVDREEITVIGRLPEPEAEQSEARASGRASRFREETRQERMRIADEAQDKYGRKVSWGVEVGSRRVRRANPVHPHRGSGDDAPAAAGAPGARHPRRRRVARSRSDALAWSVKLVGEHTDEWLTKLRDAMRNVDDLRSEGPQV